jgi:LacI family kdg operon repressor
LREEAFRAAIDTQSRARGQTVVLELGDAAAVEGALAELDKELDRALADAPDRATRATHVTQAAAAPAPRIALFAANGPVALCLARHLNARYGMRWQERIALLSIDDPEWAEFAGITAIRQPTYQIGYRAVEFLHERIDGVQTAVRDCLLPGELIVRESTSR